MARPAPAAARALTIIDELVSHPGERFTISDIARRTGISLGSAHAVLAVLEETGYLMRHPTRRTYRLGPALVGAGLAALEQHPAIPAAIDQMSELANELGVDVVVTAPTPTGIVFVAVGDTASRYGPGYREGDRVPLEPPYGLVFLAWADQAEVDRWSARASATLDRHRVELALATVRERGYALGMTPEMPAVTDDGATGPGEDVRPEPLRAAGHDAPGGVPSLHDDYDLPVIEPDQRYDLGMASAPVFDPDGRVLVAITASGFSPGILGRDVVDIGERVRARATIVTKQTRGRLPA